MDKKNIETDNILKTVTAVSTFLVIIVGFTKNLFPPFVSSLTLYHFSALMIL